jgi:hypothetical protein
MKSFIFLILVVTMLSDPHFWAQSSSGNVPIRVILPQGLKPSSCQFKYFLIGPFGGYGGFARPKLNASQFEIETVYEGMAVESLKALLWCSGYQLQTMTFDSLPASANRTVQVNPTPLGTIRFLGLVRGLTSQNAQVVYVDVDYIPWWVCEFFGLPDCALGAWRIVSVKLDTDGTFAATLPDFAKDAVISSFQNHGEFAFRIRDQKTGNPLFELKPVGSRSPLGSVAVADSYPSLQVFDAELSK